MSSFDGKAFGAAIVTAVKEHLSRRLLPLERRLAALEAAAGKSSAESQKPRYRVPAGRGNDQDT